VQTIHTIGTRTAADKSLEDRREARRIRREALRSASKRYTKEGFQKAN
jgi:hypothetical protein